LGDPPTFGSVSWGRVTIMFNLLPDLAARVEGHQHWINAEDVDALHQFHKERGAPIVAPIENKPWGAREYTVEDPNGYHLRFASMATGQTAKSIPLPEGIQILRRKPTEEEHTRVAGEFFPPKDMSAKCLESSWAGIVALSPEGEAIGAVRIVCDAPGWYSIWDVAVLPDWQGRRVGEAMMKEAVQLVREASPGACVYLFTFKHGFYEKLGFEKETVSMRKV